MKVKIVHFGDRPCSQHGGVWGGFAISCLLEGGAIPSSDYRPRMVQTRSALWTCLKIFTHGVHGLLALFPDHSATCCVFLPKMLVSN